MMDEDDVRVLLSDADVPPVGVDIADVVRRGDRKIRRRRTTEVAASVAIAAALVAVVVMPLALHAQVNRRAGAAPLASISGSPAASPATPAGSPAANGVTKTCAASALPVPDGMNEVDATVVDPSGRYIGGGMQKGEDFVPVLWTDGKPQRFPVYNSSVEIAAINVHGVVVGLGNAGGASEDYVYRYDHGVTTKLTLPPGKWHVFAYPAINAAGDIVINVEPTGETGGEHSFAVIWRAGHDIATKIPLPKGANVDGINDDDIVIGGIYKEGYGVSAWAWDLKGKGRKLTVPAGMTGLAYQVSGDWATGGLWTGDDSDPSAQVPLWNIKTGALTKIGNAKGARNIAGAVNSSGWVIDGNGDVNMNGVVAKLSPLVKGLNTIAKEIADNGLVVGSSDGSDDSTLSPAEWHC
jgi:hypothetical protein